MSNNSIGRASTNHPSNYKFNNNNEPWLMNVDTLLHDTSQRINQSQVSQTAQYIQDNSSVLDMNINNLSTTDLNIISKNNNIVLEAGLNSNNDKKVLVNKCNFEVSGGKIINNN